MHNIFQNFLCILLKLWMLYKLAIFGFMMVETILAGLFGGHSHSHSHVEGHDVKKPIENKSFVDLAAIADQETTAHQLNNTGLDKKARESNPYVKCGSVAEQDKAFVSAETQHIRHDQSNERQFNENSSKKV